MNTIRSARWAPTLLAALLAGTLLAACGSSSSGSSTTAGPNTTSTTAAVGSGPNAARRAALRECLAQHGVTLPARRPGSGPPRGAGGGAGGLFGGGGGGGGARGLANNPKLAAAFRACGGVGAGGRRRFALSHAAINRFVTCVRQRGFNMPGPNFSGKVPVFPASIRTNKKFVAASRACANLLVRPRAGAPAGGGASTSGA